MASEKRESKFEKAFVRQSMPLFEVLVSACDLDPIEAEILRLKRFDESRPNEEQILEILRYKYAYFYSDRYFRKHWSRIQKKIESVLP